MVVNSLIQLGSGHGLEHEADDLQWAFSIRIFL